MKEKIKFLVGLLLFIVAVFVFLAWYDEATTAELPPPFVGQVTAVTDGDTIQVQKSGDGGEQWKIRLYGIDAPEKKQAFGQAAREYAATLVAGREVTVTPMAVDRYGRLVAWVVVDGTLLQAALLRHGMAWLYRDYCREDLCGRLELLEYAAKEDLAGLWVEPQPRPPWEWRRDRRDAAAAKRRGGEQ